MRLPILTERLIWVGAMIGALCLVSCGYRERVSASEVKKRIDESIPIGSRVNEVVAFLGSFEINGLKAESFGPVPGKPSGTNKLEGRNDEVFQYLSARIKD